MSIYLTSQTAVKLDYCLCIASAHTFGCTLSFMCCNIVYLMEDGLACLIASVLRHSCEGVAQFGDDCKRNDPVTYLLANQQMPLQTTQQIIALLTCIKKGKKSSR